MELNKSENEANGSKKIKIFEPVIINMLVIFLFQIKFFSKSNNILHFGHFCFQCILRSNLKLIDGYTMIVPSYIARIKILREFLLFTLTNPPKYLYEIIINWASNKDEIEELIREMNNQTFTKSIRYFISNNDKTVNRRFYLPFNIKTEAFLSIDDDILMNATDIDYGYKIWTNHRNQIVGYTRRGFTISYNKRLKYDHKSSRLILTNIAFLDHKLIELYYDEKNKPIVELVKKLNNCEDILMNFIVTKYYNLSGVFINRKFIHLGNKKGLSTSKSHYRKRHLCVNKFYSFFGVLPQKITEILE